MERITRSLVPNHRLLPEVKDTDNWICWSRHQDPEKDEPVPVDTGEYNTTMGLFEAKSYDDPQIRLSYSEARQQYQRSDLISGIGFVVKESEFYYVDLDNCVDADRLIVSPEIKDILTELDSYTELSPSGTGLHVICRGTPPRVGWSHKSRDLEIEVYNKSWVTVSEEHIAPTPMNARLADDAIQSICNSFRIDIYNEE